ncbi:hypothetical protein [Aureimonas frigidaquae]|uniref:hypothetical protein n=1 Tax=Aureimonas frigidaquae TaxID=424757 RepID=UPI000783CB6C|nr:hypothetical protein [Aureimonas frigidaquae]
MSTNFISSDNGKQNSSYEGDAISRPDQEAKSNEESVLPALRERDNLGGQSVDRDMVPGCQSDNIRKEGLVDTETSKPKKDLRLSVSEAFGIDERNLHQKHDDGSLARAVADLD